MLQRKLAIVSSHPIQYYSPVFRALAALGSIDLRVFYTWSQTADNHGVFDPGFGGDVKWDIPLLDGYAHQFVRNVAARPGTHHFGGLRNPTLVREIEDWGPEAVLVYGWNSRSHLQVLRHFKGHLPVLFRGDSTLLDPRSRWRSWVRRAFLRWVYSHVDVPIAVGANNRDYFAWCGLPQKRIAFAPHSVDTVRFGYDASQDSRAVQWRLRLGIGPDAIVFLFAGKLQHQKNPELLLDSFAALHEASGARSHLVFVGNGELEVGLKAAAGGNNNVHFLPFQNQTSMPAVYRLGDVFVLPSRTETWGLALNESMASGRPVIASSRTGGARDLIEQNVTGWTFDSGDRKSLTDVMHQAVDRGRAGLRDMGMVAQARSAAWSTEASAQGIADAVLSCLRSDVRPSSS
jgi:glycosyltransferase involved in cell wall biosynthesis